MNLREVLRIVRPLSALDEVRLRNLNTLAQETIDVPGDVVECGVGGSAAVLAWAIERSSKDLWLYDTFNGLPEPTVKDGPEAVRYAGLSAFSTLTLRTLLDQVGFPAKRTHVMEGNYAGAEGNCAGTFGERGPSRVSLLHVDCDWYDSVYRSLWRFGHLVPTGGVIILDDFGFWPGARKALQTYLNEAGISLPNLERVGEAAWWKKE